MTEADSVRFTDNDCRYFNGFRLESITIEEAMVGEWRFHLSTPKSQGEDEARFTSKAYKSPKEAITALDTKCRPWIRPTWWIIGIPMIMLFTYHQGESHGEKNGAVYQFSRLCGDSADNMLSEQVPNHNNQTPVYIQQYCKNWLLEDMMNKLDGTK